MKVMRINLSKFKVFNVMVASCHLLNSFSCKAAQTETMLLILKQDSHPVLAAAALDETIGHFGQQMMYLLLSPHADIQREFLDRVRINTIRHFQVKCLLV